MIEALKYSTRNIAHVIMSTISPHEPHLVKIAPGFISPHIAKVTTQFFFISLYAKSIHGPRAQVDHHFYMMQNKGVGIQSATEMCQ